MNGQLAVNLDDFDVSVELKAFNWWMLFYEVPIGDHGGLNGLPSLQDDFL